MSEYNNTSVGGSSCSYASLSNYNNGSQGMNPPVPAGTTVGKYIVPDYAPPGYASISSGVPSCSGYRTINQAYGTDANGNCGTKFVSRSCGGN